MFRNHILFFNTNILLSLIFLFGYATQTSANKPASILIPPKNQVVLERKVASLWCSADGDPKPSVSWLKDGKPLNKKRLIIIKFETGSVLRLEPTKRERDEGLYECLAENSIGEPVKSAADVRVINEEPKGFPRILSQSAESVTVEMERMATLTCKVEGTPEPEVSWIKNSLPIEILDINVQTSYNNGTAYLKIANATDKDKGVYECMAYNSVGVAVSNITTVHVKVRTVSPFFTRSPQPIYEVIAGPTSSLELPCVANGSPMPTITWEKNGHELGSGTIPSIGMKTLTIPHDNLETANYTCVARSKSGENRTHTSVVVKTLPPEPKDVQISDITHNSIRLTWLYPPTPESGLSFIIRYRPRNIDSKEYKEISGVTTNYYSVTDLSPSTEYEFDVVAANSVGRGASSQSSFVTTLDQGQGINTVAAKNLKAKPSSSNSIYLSWDPPELGSDSVTGYTIYYTNNPNKPLTTWSSQIIDNGQLTTLNDLIPDTEYTVQIQTKTTRGGGPLSPQITFKTQQGVPGMPLNVHESSKSPTSIQINWSKPTDLTETLSGYEIYWNDTYTQQISQRSLPDLESYTIQNLSPDTVYRIWLTAKSRRGEGSASVPISARTEKFVPPPPPSDILAKPYTDYIQLHWKAPIHDKISLPIKAYRINLSESSDENGEGSRPQVILVDSIDGSYNLTDLSQSTLYRIKIQAITSFVDGEFSKYLFVKTLDEFIPKAPTNLKITSSSSENSVTVEWDAPQEKENNDLIRGYQIFIQELSIRDKSPIGEPIKKDVIDSTARSFVLDDLQPATEYTIQVAAVTRKGTGIFSSPKKVATRGGVPFKPEVSFRIVKDEPDAVEILWSRPNNSFGQLFDYRLKYSHKDGSHQNELTINPTISSKVIKDLHKGVVYDFRLTARNLNGYGQEAQVFVDAPEGVPDAGPSDLSYKLISPTDVTLTWSQPPDDKRNGNITYYQVYFGRTGMPPEKDVEISENKLVISSLNENTEYIFKVRARTKVGYGPFSATKSFLTPRDLPPAPSNVRAMADTFRSIIVWWDEMAYFSGIVGYRIYYTKNPSDDLEKWSTKNITVTSSAIIDGLHDNTHYTLRVCAINTVGFGKLSEVITTTTVPVDVPLDLKVIRKTTHSATLVWKPPMKLVPTKYNICFDAYKQFHDSEGTLQTLNIAKKVVVLSPSIYEHTFEDLMPFTKYHFNITAVPPNESFRPPSQIYVTTLMAAPKPLVKPECRSSVVNTFISCTLPLASEEYGPINFYYVIVVPGDMPLDFQRDPDSILIEDLPPTHISVDSRSPYAAAKISRLKMRKDFVLGDGETYDGYTNKLLNREQNYRIFVRAIVDAPSKSLYTSSPLSDPLLPASPNSLKVLPSDENPSKTGVVLGFIIVILAMVIVAIFITQFFKRKQQAIKSNHVHNETTMKLLPDMHVDRTYTIQPNDPVELRRINYQSPAMMNHPPILVSELANHIEELKVNDNLKQEYESIEPGQQFTWENSNLDVNRPKNRYGNVVAYDHSRVVMRPIDSIVGSDYINANFCDGYRKPNAYIATQGPLPNTVGDFWRMVWEQKSKTLVMMTQLEERGRVKCVHYWPAKDPETHHGITISVRKVEELAYYSIRTFQVQHELSSEIREVKQFQYTAWPDHGVPDHPTPFLMFLKRIKISNPPNAGPLIVLCSAGVGRTGCFIVIDSMIERIKYENSIDIYGHVTCLRAQRNYIVQTEDQYMFIHDAVVEAVIAANTEVPETRLYEHLQRLMQLVPGEPATALEIEFKRLASIKTGPQKFISANLPVNKYKNRLMNILPYESTRVCLEPIGLEEGSDYINASFIDGYRQRNAYIATQSPMPDTVEDFWRMLVEHNSSIIVMLTKLKEMGREKCTQYWPAERSGEYGPYCITLNRQFNETSPHFIFREFTITDRRETSYHKDRIIRQFHLINWPEQGVPKSGDSFMKLISEVHKTKENFGLEGPITVHCSAGVGRTGAFIALSIMLERLDNEHVLDLFETVRTLRTQRPGMVQTEDQYQFCYQTALEYIRNFDQCTQQSTYN